VPIFASDSGEIPHVVEDAGLVVPEADEPAWVAGLQGLLESPATRRELSGRGLARARDRYAWPIVARKYLEFFDELREASVADRCGNLSG
jgi:glycosyltransferase involved in cell wall biosynthesis